MALDILSYLMGQKTGKAGGAVNGMGCGRLFKYAVLSENSRDIVYRGGRYFARDSSEPVIILPTTNTQDTYTGYAFISFAAEAISGTPSANGDLVDRTAKTTPNGTPYYVQRMSGMFPTSEASNKLHIFYGTERQNEMYCTITPSVITYDANSKSFRGDPDVLTMLDAVIDGVYQEYYAGE